MSISFLAFVAPLYAIDYEDEMCVANKKENVTNCLESHLKNLRIKYSSLRKLVTQQMIELDEATLREEAEKTYQESERSFRYFMQKNCAWHAASTMGGINGRQNALRCEIRSIQLRLEELRSALGH